MEHQRGRASAEATGGQARSQGHLSGSDVVSLEIQKGPSRAEEEGRLRAERRLQAWSQGRATAGVGGFVSSLQDTIWKLGPEVGSPGGSLSCPSWPLHCTWSLGQAGEARGAPGLSQALGISKAVSRGLHDLLSVFPSLKMFLPFTTPLPPSSGGNPTAPSCFQGPLHPVAEGYRSSQKRKAGGTLRIMSLQMETEAQSGEGACLWSHSTLVTGLRS